MRCPTKAAPMPPAQAEALCDLGLEERRQDCADPEPFTTEPNRYPDPFNRRAERPLAAQKANTSNSRMSSLQQVSSENTSLPAAQAPVYPPS